MHWKHLGLGLLAGNFLLACGHKDDGGTGSEVSSINIAMPKTENIPESLRSLVTGYALIIKPKNNCAGTLVDKVGDLKATSIDASISQNCDYVIAVDIGQLENNKLKERYYTNYKDKDVFTGKTITKSELVGKKSLKIGIDVTLTSEGLAKKLPKIETDHPTTDLDIGINIKNDPIQTPTIPEPNSSSSSTPKLEETKINYDISAKVRVTQSEVSVYASNATKAALAKAVTFTSELSKDPVSSYIWCSNIYKARLELDSILNDKTTSKPMPNAIPKLEDTQKYLEKIHTEQCPNDVNKSLYKKPNDANYTIDGEAGSFYDENGEISTILTLAYVTPKDLKMTCSMDVQLFYKDAAGVTKSLPKETLTSSASGQNQLLSKYYPRYRLLQDGEMFEFEKTTMEISCK